jgi:hypothetical protein
MYTSFFRKAMLGDTATLNLDFTTGTLDSRLTFTRAANTATYINSSGYVTTATANTPRFDYDPATLAPRGLLIEGSAINVCPRSQELTTGWQNVAMNTPTVPSSPTITDPFGGTSATWKLVASSSGTSVPHTWRTATLTFTAASYTFSFWAKAAEYDRIMLCDPGSGQGGCLFVLTGNGTATVVANVVTPTNPQITPYPNGWYRCSVTMVTAAANYAFGISGYPSSGATTAAFGPNYISDGTSGVYATAMQIELGSGASSYIPTGASQVTRNADLCYMSDISSLSYSATNGSMFYEGSFSKINSAAYPTRMGFLTAAGGDPAFEIFVNGTTIFSGIRSVPANNEITRTIATNTNYKFATSFNAAASSQVRCSINGAAVVGSGSSALTATRTPTVFGFTRSGYELYFPSGTIKSAKYWNTTLTDADLVSKST